MESEGLCRKKTVPTERYCRCLMRVRPKVENPYGICTRSVLHKYPGVKRPTCAYKDLSVFTTPELRAYAVEMKIPGARRASRKTLLALLIYSK